MSPLRYAPAALPDDLARHYARRLGEQPAAFLLLRDDGPSDKELGDFLRGAGLAPQKIPGVWRRVEELPRTASGKVKKFVLQAELAEPG